MRRFETSEPPFGVDADVAQKLMHLENEVRQKRDEVQTLREQVRIDVTGKSFSPLVICKFVSRICCS